MHLFDLLLWAVRALSLFNTIAFLWLGLAVLLNAQRRVAGTWITGGGLLLAGFFFAVHSTLVCRPFDNLDAEMAFWWPVLWLLFVIPPFLWYVVISWYAGVLGAGWCRARLLATGLLGVGVLALPSVADLVPAYEEVARGGAARLLSLGPLPAAVLVYPGYGALCFLLALEVLRRPGTSSRFLGDLGRRRARPWLVASSLALLAVSLSVGIVATWLLEGTRTGRIDLYSGKTLALLIAADLAISGLLALVVLLLGRSIVSYEIFTGKTLPRGGLLRHWRNSLILAGGYGTLVGGSLALPLDPIYGLMLATLLIAVFYALLSWRSYLEREHSMAQLRPFVASQRLYEQMLAPAARLEVEVALPFRALCQEVLGARVAFLVALGPLAPLAGPPLAYPPWAVPPLAELGKLASSLREPGALLVPLEPDHFAGAVWAVPLWSERGLIGTLLLGNKRDGGLYVQEEIEIARAAGERLIDLQASTEMARRLMAVQRQRLAETQLLDRRARRVLHDDVLPRLHAALLALSGPGPAESAAEAVASLAEAHKQISELLRAMPGPVAPEVARHGLMGALREVVEGELRDAFDGVAWQVEPEVERAAGALSPLAAEVVFGAARETIRNAARHGRDRESGRPLHLAVAAAWRAGLQITVEDDGVGLGTATTPSPGSGQGLALHSTMMAVLGGTLSIDTVPGARTRVSLVLPEDS